MMNYMSKLEKFYTEVIANQMVKGLLNETEKIRDIHRVLIADGLTPGEVSYYMNIDEDFIPDVLQAYKGEN